MAIYIDVDKRNILLERGDKPEKEGGEGGRGVDVEMGTGAATFLLLYSSVQSHLYFRIFSLLS